MRKLDNALINGTDYLAGELQEKYGFSLPAILRESVALQIILFGYLSYRNFVGSFGSIWGGLFLLLSIAIIWAMAMRWRTLNADAQKEWSPKLAGKYLGEAIMSRRRNVLRYFEIVVTAIFVSLNVLAFMLIGREGLDFLHITLLILVGAVYSYLQCVYPRDPGSRTESRALVYGAG